MADVTGDGRADAIAVKDHGVYVRHSNGRGFVPDDDPWTEIGYHGTRGTFLADVTGDGRADAIVLNDVLNDANRSAVGVRRSDGSQFEAHHDWGSIPAGSRGTFFADVTGDRLADAIVVNDDRVTVAASYGEGFRPSTSWTEIGYYGTRGTFFADVTGDGRADAIVLNDVLNDGNRSAVGVRRSDGSQFEAHHDWGSIPAGSRESFFTDVTGDRRADAVVVDQGVVHLRRSSASGSTTSESIGVGVRTAPVGTCSAM